MMFVQESTQQRQAAHEPMRAALPASDDAIERLHTAETVREALPSLSGEHRGLIVEVYYSGRSAGETVARLGIREGTVKCRHVPRTTQASPCRGPGRRHSLAVPVTRCPGPRAGHRFRTRLGLLAHPVARAYH
jgi:hypothetical protein